jgi:hypothetical protein
MNNLQQVGCPRNNQIFFRFKLKQTETQSVLVVFRFVSRNQKTFFSVCFGLFRCFGLVSKQLKQKNFCQNRQKKSPKNFSIRGSMKLLIFFLGSNRNKPKLNLFWLFLGLFSCETPKIFFRFVSMFRTGIETTKTNRTYSMGNEKG